MKTSIPPSADPERVVEPSANVNHETAIPVLAEEVQAGVRKVQTGGVRVHKTVVEHDEVIDQELHSEEIDVRRVIKNEVVSGPQPVRQVGDITIVPVVKEVLKIEKQFVLTEELHIVKGRRTNRDQQRVTLRHEDARVERIDAEGRSVGPAVVKDTTPVHPAVVKDATPVHPSVLGGDATGRKRFVRKNKIIK